jgi:hypothetical protein
LLLGRGPKQRSVPTDVDRLRLGREIKQNGRMKDWLFRSRVTGEITYGQRPNVTLIAYYVLWAVRRFVKPTGQTGSVVSGVTDGLITVWAIDELARGVNPFRRMIGGATLAWRLRSVMAE